MLQHELPFDPSYGYDLNGLLAIDPPLPPEGFTAFWQDRYTRALAVDPAPIVSPSHHEHPRFRVFDLEYRSTDGFPIRGWLLRPTFKEAKRGFVLGHGYGGIEAPDFELPRNDAIYLVPCFRGLCRSRRPPISDDPNYHVLHDVQDPARYIVGGCVEDLWTGVSALLQIDPKVAGHLGYMGISFGGGVGALALPWDERIHRAHLNAPTFGNQPLRLSLPTLGSAAALQEFARHHPEVRETLAFYDAAVAARFIRQPMHIAAALFDPAVAPPGQFSIYNAISAEKQLFVLTAGHFDYPGKDAQNQHLLEELRIFFATL
jgi:cephalosporin-C deacetylase